MMVGDYERRDDFFLGLSAAGFHRNHYAEWLPVADENGPPVICVHGLTRNSGDFDDLAIALAGNYGRRTLAADVVGRGRSDWLADPKLYGYPQYLADAAALLARVNAEQADWVGTSMGGLIGMLLAAQPKSPIRRLVINDVGPLVPKSGLERIAAYVGKDPVFDDIAGVEAYLRYVLAGFGAAPDASWRRMALRSARALPDGSFGLAYDPGIAAAFTAAPLADVDLWSAWDQIKCPVLVLRGENSDILSAETHAQMASRGPCATILTLPNMGHAPSLMTDEQIGLVARFLTSDI